MKRIGIISDTHSFLDDKVFQHFADCDEIWHGGDFGSIELIEKLRSFKPLKGVYGNIDGTEIRADFPEKLIFQCEQVKVFMIHIGGYPGKYAPRVKNDIRQSGAQLFISGHSHILKVMFDEELQCLHINPGAAGNSGWHKVKTLIKLTIDGDKMKDLQVIEIGKRGN